MRAKDIKDFARRDWSAIAARKSERWLDVRRRFGPVEGLRLADRLRRQVLASRPDWPTPQDRSSDLRHHLLVAELLRRVSARRKH